jgi:hypothetical protein
MRCLGEQVEIENKWFDWPSFFLITAEVCQALTDYGAHGESQRL